MKKTLLYGAIIYSINLNAQTPGGGAKDMDGNKYSTVISF